MKIVAIGGGENGRPGTEYETYFADSEIVKLSDKKNPSVLFIPPLSDSQENYFEIMNSIFSKLGCSVSPLYLDGNDFDPSVILNFDIIYVGGGNTLRMLEYWRSYGIDSILKKALDKDIVLSGVSAGAICWFKYGSSDSAKMEDSEANYIRINALNFIPALFCPHYDQKGRRDSLEFIMNGVFEVGLALDNCSAIEIVDDKYRIIRTTGNAYRVFNSEGKFVEEKLEVSSEFKPISELLMK